MKAIKRKPVVLDVANQIRAAILDGGLVPGSKIAQDDLAAELGVSRLPIRQALLVLQREGLVFLDHVPRRGGGAARHQVHFRPVRLSCDCRRYIAGILAARENFDATTLNRIVREGREAARRGESRRDLVMEFHMAQYEAVGNQVLIRIMKPMLDHVQRVVIFVQDSTSKSSGRRKTVAGKGSLASRSQMDTWNEHAEIVEAITQRRVGRAARLGPGARREGETSGDPIPGVRRAAVAPRRHRLATAAVPEMSRAS